VFLSWEHALLDPRSTRKRTWGLSGSENQHQFCAVLGTEQHEIVLDEVASIRPALSCSPFFVSVKLVESVFSKENGCEEAFFGRADRLVPEAGLGGRAGA